VVSGAGREGGAGRDAESAGQGIYARFLMDADDRPPTTREPVLTDEVPRPSRPSGPDVSPAGRFRRRWRRVLIGAAAVVLVLAGLTARLFVWPATGMPDRVDAIIMLNNPGDPLPVALQLARDHRARYLVVSQGTVASHYACPAPVPGVKLICFHPSPATTQGEAEFAGRLASKYHWRSVVIVTIAPQDVRARLRLERCFSGHVYVMTSSLPKRLWPYQVVYEWGATIKALTVQRSC
jgi:hypothetical protein